MYSTSLPLKFRPNVKHRELKLGTDVPAKFFYDMKAIDDKLHLVFHEIETLPTEPVINQYYGSLEDYRTPVHVAHGSMCWGFPLYTKRDGPKYQYSWHIYRLEAAGWAHVIDLQSKEPAYLRAVIENIYTQAKLKKVSKTAYREHLDNTDQETRAKKMSEKEQLLMDIQTENKGFMKKVMENYEAGHVKPTNPTKDIITSYSGQTNRSRIIRPLGDKEGGLILPDKF